MTRSRAAETRLIGARAVQVSAIGAGTASLGNVFGEVTPQAATSLVDACEMHGIEYFDTAPLYGNGLSESRLGRALSLATRQFSLSTKVGRTLDPTAPEGWRFDFSRDAILKSLEGSLRRLGRDKVDIVYIHDPDSHEEDVYREAWPTLEQLRSEGVIDAIGFGMNQWEMPLRFLQRLDVDVLMIAGRYTLLDTSADRELLPLCMERGVSVALAGVFNSGILADPVDGAWYDYRPASSELLRRARRMRSIANAYELSLPAVALNFALAHPAASTVVVGVGSATTLEQNVASANITVPSELWTRFKEEGLMGT